MRYNSPLFPNLSVLVCVLTISACTSGSPIILDPSAPGVHQARFASGLVARFNPSTAEVWIGAPAGATAPRSEVLIRVPGDLPGRVQSLDDGGFVYRFAGDANSTADVEWVDPSRIRHVETVSVTDPADHFVLNIGTAGLYPNRMTAQGDIIWVVNSGNDELTAYDVDTLDPTGTRVSAPAWSNPWEAAFRTSTEGVLTTLFCGVFLFDTASGHLIEVETNGFRDFASPNGCCIADGECWVTNPNPVSYFPTQMGPSWVSLIALDGEPAVVDEIDTSFLNPQHVISDDSYVYVSCSGTIDFMPPDFHAAALDPGGVHVIDPASRKIVATYDLGLCGPGPMALSPDGRYLYAGSSVAGWLLRIDLEDRRVLNDAADPIVVSDFPGTFVPFLEVTPSGLLFCASFNTDTIHFVDSWTGERNPFPFFQPVALHPDDPDALWGVQDAVVVSRGGKTGLLILTTVVSAFHWVPL